MQGHIELKSPKPTLNTFLAAGVLDTDPRAHARLLWLLHSVSVEANDANFRELACFMTAFESATLTKT